MSKRIHSKSGFTLVETLVVLVIIGVLAALLFPVFARVREDARRATCQSNLQQIGLAIGQYKQDSQGFYPPVLQGKIFWTQLLAPYAKSHQIFICPSQSSGWVYDYGGDNVNTWVFAGKNVFIYGKNESTIKDETSAIVFHDSTQMLDSRDTSGITSAPSLYLAVPKTCAAMSNGEPVVAFSNPTVHAGGGNYAFADGHVKWLSPENRVAIECEAGSPAP